MIRMLRALAVLAVALGGLAILPSSATAAPAGPARWVPSQVALTASASDPLAVRVAFTITNGGPGRGIRTSDRPVRVRLVGQHQVHRVGTVDVRPLGPGRSVERVVRGRLPDRTHPGAYRAQVCVRSQQRVRCDRSEARITVAGPDLRLDPPTLDFGGVELGSTSAEQVLTLTNHGDLPSGAVVVGLAGAGAAPYAVGAEDCSGSPLAAGASCTVPVTFAPVSRGPSSAQVTVTAGPGQEATTDLSGTGQATGALEVSPTSEEFENVVVGSSSSTRTFAVTNTGDLATGALTAGTSGPDAAAFEISADTCSGAPLAAGASCSVDVTFAPSAADPATAALDVVASPGGTASASLSGTGLAPATLEVSPDDHDFGGIETDTDSVPQELTVTNTGDVASSTVDVGLGGADGSEFDLGGDTCSGTSLDPGEECTLAVTFHPTSTGAKSASVTAGATTGGEATTSLTGTGLAPAELTLSPSTHDFGNVVTGGSLTHTFTVTNNGGVSSGAVTVDLGGPGVTSFERTSDACTGGALASGESCSVEVRFNPTANGAASADVEVTAVNVATPVSSSVTGTGVATAAHLVFDPPTRGYNPIPGGGSFSTPVYITNTGAADAHDLVFAAGTPLTGNVTIVSFGAGIPNGSPHPACGAVIPGGSTCGGFMYWSASSALDPTQASLTVTGTPGGSATFTATFGGP